MTRLLFPLKDLSHIPDDYLDALLLLIDETADSSDDSRFAAEIEAIFRMREITRREGRTFSAHSANARAEKLRREGKPVPVERDQVYECDEGFLEITRISFKAGWFYSRPAGTDGSWGKRRPLPLPADWRLAGWTR